MYVDEDDDEDSIVSSDGNVAAHLQLLSVHVHIQVALLYMHIRYYSQMNWSSLNICYISIAV